MEAEERVDSLENIGRKMKENNGMVMVVILIIMDSHNGPWLLKTHQGQVCAFISDNLHNLMGRFC